MGDRNQTIKVRIKAAVLLGFLAKYDSLGSPELYEQYFLSDLKQKTRLFSTVCQDLHWEVRKEMCQNLYEIQKYIGPQKTKEYILPELTELLDDEEAEVASEAIY